MPFSLLFFIVLLLPVLEIYLLISWVVESPLVALLYLFITMGLGALLIKVAKIGFGEIIRIMREQSGAGLGALIGFGKLWAVGILLFFPGYLSDVLALAIALFPVKAQPTPNRPTDDGIVNR
jgi:UPF0716 family protein affecting phage T7 exclusion